MYTIGDFSRIGKVSTKMLRYYDKIELLKPDYTNPNNGYRYYSINHQLSLNKINSSIIGDSLYGYLYNAYGCGSYGDGTYGI